MDWTHRLRLRHLQVLMNLAETQNISRSALELHMTQPALSKWLKELESDIGLTLFERHARGLRPTHHGHSLIVFAARVANELDRARDEMDALLRGSSGRVVVGASGAAIASAVPSAILALLKSMPSADVEVVEGPMDRLVHQLRQREIDLAVGRPSAKYRYAELRSEPLYEERLTFAVRPGHPLAGRRKPDWADLLAQRWVVWSRDIPVRELLDATLDAAGHSIPEGSVQSNSLLATIALVAESDMVAVVSERTIDLHARMKALRRLPLHLDPSTAVTMYWRHEPASSTVVEGLIEALRVIARGRATGQGRPGEAISRRGPSTARASS